MIPKLWRAVLVAALLFASPAAFAVDGDVYRDGNGDGDYVDSSGTFLFAGYPGGAAIVLCDSKTTTGACSGGSGVRLTRTAKPTGALTFRLLRATTCSAVSVSFTIADISTGGPTDTLPVTLTLSEPSVTINAGEAFPRGWLFTTVDTATDCTDLDVILHLE